MGIEHMNFPAASDPERMEAAGFSITIRPKDHPDWVTMSLGRERINYEVDVNRQTGEVYGSIRVDMGHSADHELVKRRKEEIPAAVLEALGLSSTQPRENVDPEEPEDFWSAPEHVRHAEAARLAAERGDHRPDVQ